MDNSYTLRFPETLRRKAPHRRSCQPEEWTLVGVVVKQYIPASAASQLTSGGILFTPLEAKVTGPATFAVVKTDFSVRTYVPVIGIGSRFCSL
ncbi:hypothetical protein Bca101_066398 [Brassica carinata]